MIKAEPVLLVGSIALDTIETPSDSRNDILGGSSTYALLAAASGSPVHVVGVVGRDFPEDALQLYRNSSADLTDLRIEDGETFRWGGRYHKNMEDRDTLFTELGVFEHFTPNLSSHNRNCRFLFLANIHPDLQMNVVSQMDRDPLVVIDTMNLWIDIARPALDRVLSHTHILLINESEANLYSGCAGLDDAAGFLRDRGPQTVIIKRGSKGAVIYSGGNPVQVGVYPVPAMVDPTGAGDAFGGGFISGLANGDSMIEAACRGTAFASVCIEGFGPERLIGIGTGEISRRVNIIRNTVNP